MQVKKAKLQWTLMEVLCERVLPKSELICQLLCTSVQRCHESFWTCFLHSRKVKNPAGSLSLIYPLHLQLSFLLWDSEPKSNDTCWNPTLPGHSVSESIRTFFPHEVSVSQCVLSYPNSFSSSIRTLWLNKINL